MAELGYERYGAQGGDAGSFIAPQLGRIDTEHVAGVHLNDPITIPSWVTTDLVTAQTIRRSWRK